MAGATVGLGVVEAIFRIRDEVSRGLGKMNSALQRNHKEFSQAGRALMPFSAALGAVGAISLKMSTDFNQAMANVATLIPDSKKRVLELKEEVRDLSVDTGKSTKDLADGLYQVVSAFGDTADTAEILEINAKAAAAGLATTTDSINLTSAVTKGYGDVSVEAMKKAANLGFMTVKLGQTTYPELAQSMGRVIPIAAALNVKQEELFTAFATLTGVTGKADEVSTQLRATMSAMLSPTEQMKKAMKDLGVESVDAMIAQYGLAGSIVELIKQTDGSKEAIGDLFPQIRALPGIFAITGGQADTLARKMGLMQNFSGAMTEAFDEVSKGVNQAGFRFEQAKRRIGIVMEKLGDIIGPILADVLDMMKPLFSMLEWGLGVFEKAPMPVKALAVAIGLVGTAAGPTLWALGSFGMALEFLSPHLTAVSVRLKKLQADLLRIPGAAKAASIALKAGLFVGVSAAAYEATRKVVEFSDEISGIERVKVKSDLMTGLQQLPSLVRFATDSFRDMKGVVGDVFDFAIKRTASYVSTIQNMSDQIAKMTFGPGEEARGHREGAELDAIRAAYARVQAMKAERAGAPAATGVGDQAASAIKLSAEAQKELLSVTAEINRARAEGLPALQQEIQLIRIATKEKLAEIDASDESAAVREKLKAAQMSLSAVQIQMIQQQHALREASELASMRFELQREIIAGMVDPYERQLAMIDLNIQAKIAEINANVELDEAQKQARISLVQQSAATQTAAAHTNEYVRVLSLLGREPIEKVKQGYEDINKAIVLATDATGDFSKLSDKELDIVVKELRRLQLQAKAAGEEIAGLPDALREAWREQQTRLGEEEKKIHEQAKGIGETFTEGLKAGLEGVPDIIIGALQGGGDVGKSIGASFGKEIGGKLQEQVTNKLSGVLGTGLGGALGAAMPGIGTVVGGFAGSLIGKGLSSVFGIGGGPSPEELAQEARDAFIDASGGVAELRKVADEAGVSLDKLFGAKRKEDVEAYQENLSELVDLQGQLADIADEAYGKIASGMRAGVEGIQILSAEDARAQASIAMLSFQEVFQREGLLAAADAFQPIADKLRESLEAIGGDADVEKLLEPMFYKIGMASNETFRSATEGAQGLADVLRGFRANELTMTADQFSAFGQQASAAFKQAMSVTNNEKLALQSIAPLLGQIKGAAAQYGFELDANTQKLIEQAGAAGVAFPTDPIDRLVEAISALVVQLGGELPVAVNSAASTITTTMTSSGAVIHGALYGPLVTTQREFGLLTQAAVESTDSITNQFVAAGVAFEEQADQLGLALDYTRLGINTMAGMATESIGRVTQSTTSLGGAWSGVRKEVERAANAMGNLPDVSGGVPNVGGIPDNIPHMQHGGIVDEPTLIVAGEAGPEAITPLSESGGVGSMDWDMLKQHDDHLINKFSRAVRDGMLQARR